MTEQTALTLPQREVSGNCHGMCMSRAMRQTAKHRGMAQGQFHGPAQVFLTKEYLAIAMEFAAGGDMFQYVKHRGGLEEVEARWFFQQLIIGMDYCHKMVRPLLLSSPCWSQALANTVQSTGWLQARHLHLWILKEAMRPGRG